MTRTRYVAVDAYVYTHVGADLPIAHCASSHVAAGIAAALNHAADKNLILGTAAAREEARHARVR